MTVKLQSNPAHSQPSYLTLGRLYHEDNELLSEDPFYIDKERILYCSAFRRLQYKTQVFINHQGDYFRTRLTHTLEVAFVARTIAQKLDLNANLAECCALAHDLGHPPFGHAGEDALREEMANFGGFNHNAHTFKLITKIEERYPQFDGLNLTWETLEGIIKHNGPIKSFSNGFWYVKQYNQKHDLQLDSYPSLEAQVAAIADDIAYNIHDIQDGLRSGLLTVNDLLELDHFADTLTNMKHKYPAASEKKLLHITFNHLSYLMIEDVCNQVTSNIGKLGITTDDQVRSAGQMMVGFSDPIQKMLNEQRKFLTAKLYSHPSIKKTRIKVQNIIHTLFKFYKNNLNCMPVQWREQTSRDNIHNMHLVCDYIAGMTDRYAMRDYQSITEPYFE